MKRQIKRVMLASFVQKIFPGSKIISYKKFKTVLVNPPYKIKINKPPKNLVIKISKLKRKYHLELSDKSLKYIYEKGIPSPKVYFSGKYNNQFISAMDFVQGKTALEIFRKTNTNIKVKLLKNVGTELKKIHSLKIPSFWVHPKHEIKTERLWKVWTYQRILKYLEFIKNKWPNFYPLLEERLGIFKETLINFEFSLVPLHWDYHLSNINAQPNGKITGIFDLENLMKGHNLADIGQTVYWLHLDSDSNKYSKYFLKGYKKQFNKKELLLIEGYEILHILAVTRSIWFKQKRLGWLIKKHKKMLEEILK